MKSFKETLADYGIPEPFVKNYMYLRKVRWGEKRGEDHYWMFPFQGGANFGDWRTRFSETWFERDLETLSVEERNTVRKAQQEAYQRQEADKKKSQAKAAQRSKWAMENYPPCTAHPYADTKQFDIGNLVGTRFGNWEKWNGDQKKYVAISQNALIIPIFDPETDEISGMQGIYPTPQGDKPFTKMFPAGCKKGIFTIGDVSASNVIVIAEGVATGASIYEATGYAVLVAFDAGNMIAVAPIIRKKYPDAVILIAEDHDLPAKGKTKGEGQRASRKAANACNGTVVKTGFTDKGDFNDLKVAQGLEAVRKRFETAMGGVEEMEDAMVMEEVAEKLERIVDEEGNKALQIIPEIESSSFSKIFDVLIPHLQKMNLNFAEKEQIIVALQHRLKKLTGVEPKRADVKKQLQKPITIDDHEWCESLRYIRSKEFYYDMADRKGFSTKTLNNSYGKYVPESEKGGKLSAEKFMADHGFIEQVDSLGYFPQNANQEIVTIENMTYANIFDPKSVPQAHKGEFTEEGLRAIQKIQDHIFILFNENAPLAQTFTDWIAHQVQFPGKKIEWAFIIQSPEGMGKGFLGEVLEALLGKVNVKKVTPSQVCSRFNGWATNSCVTILEELKISGYDKYEVANRIKPLITDKTITIEEKNVPAYNTHNTTNYIAFTNEKDCVPINEKDRRFCPTFVKFETIEDFEAYLGYPAKEYFNELFSSLKNHATEIRKWLLEYKISDEFIDMHRAPMTDEKLSMAATEKATTVGYVEAEILLAEAEEKPQGKLFHRKCISSAHFFKKLFDANPELRDEMHNRERNALMRRLGYTLHPATQIKIKGEKCKVWVKDVSMTPEQIRDSFEQENNVHHFNR